MLYSRLLTRRDFYVHAPPGLNFQAISLDGGNKNRLPYTGSRQFFIDALFFSQAIHPACIGDGIKFTIFAHTYIPETLAF